MKSQPFLLILCALLALGSANCPGLPFGHLECPSSTLATPAHTAVLYASSVVPSTATVSFNLNSCEARRYSRLVTVVSVNRGATMTSFEKVVYNAPAQTFYQTIQMGSENARYEWLVYRECWENKNKRSFVSDASTLLNNLPPSNGLPAPGKSEDDWNLNSKCFIRDLNGRTDAFQCSRQFTFCKRQADNTLIAPYAGAVFQQTSVPFSWSDITPSEPDCITQLSNFYYQLSIWNTTAIQTTPPIFSFTFALTLTSFNWNPSVLNVEAGTYYWSVRSNRVADANHIVDGASTTTTTQYASPWSFRLCGADVPPTVPSLSTPTDSQSIESASYTATASGPAVSVSFSWTLANFGFTCNPGSNSFYLQIAKDNAFALNLTTYTTTSTSYSAMSTDGTWYWRVVAFNGVKYTSSAVQSFVICALLPPSPFNVISPAVNEQGVIFTNINFSWGSSSVISTCATPGQIAYTMAIGSSSTTLYNNYTGSATSFATPFSKGTWYWTVTATDSKGRSAVTPLATFTTVSSICSNSTPSVVPLGGVSYQYVGSAMQVTITWSSTNMGVSCTTTTTPYFTLTISGPSGYSLNTNLPTSTLSYTLTPAPVGPYSWTLTATNAVGLTGSSASPSSFVICNLAATSGFAGTFAPANNYLDTARTLTAISWAFTAPQTNCLGGKMVYALQITGLTTINVALPNQTVTSYDVSAFQPGTWTWTLSADVSSIPLPGLTATQYSRSFSICLPSIPNAPVLTSPARFSQNNANNATLAWSDSHSLSDSCTSFYNASQMDERYTYNVYTSKTSTFNSTPAYTTSVYRSGATSFSSPITNLTAGLVYWKVSILKEVLVSSVVTKSLTRESSASLFTVCLSTPPIAPVLSFPPNNTVFQRCNITADFQWNPMIYTDFGVDCSPTPSSGLKIYLGTNPSSLPLFVTVLPDQPGSGLQSVVNGFQAKTVYYWQVESYNSLFTASSQIFAFTSPDTTLTACSGHGSCNVQGTCDCNSGYDGVLCAYALPTESPGFSNPDGNDPPIGLIVGVVAGCLFVFLVLAIFGFVMIRRRAQRALEKPARQPPPFPPLAFVVPPGFPPLATEKIVPWYSFEQLLVVYNFALSFALLDITQATEIDEVVKSLVYVIESHGQGANFVKALISKDVKEKRDTNTLTSSTLFRDNSHASKAFKYYAKIVGLPYLFYIFGDAVYEMCTKDVSPDAAGEGKTDTMRKKSGSMRKKAGDIELNQVVVRRNSSGQGMLFDEGNFEMDPNKMADDDDVLSNALFLQLKCQKLLVRLFRSSNIFPPAFSEIFVHLMAEVEQHLTREDGYNAIAAFIFLRLVNPSILFPNQYGLTDNPPNNEGLTRRLILITKVLQNLANGVHFGGKEQHMAPLNDVIDSNKEPLRNFLDSVISKAPQDAEEKAPATNVPAAFAFVTIAVAPKDPSNDDFFKPLEVPRPTVETSLAVVYNQLHRNKDKTLDRLKDYRSSDDVKIISNKVTAITDAIGEPIVRNTGTATTDKRKEKDKE